MNRSLLSVVLDQIENINPEEIYGRFEAAWPAIMDEPLPESYDTKVPMEDGQRYRAMLDCEAWESAAVILTWPFYHKETLYNWTMTNKGYDEGKFQHAAGAVIHHPLSSGGGPRVQAFHPIPGVAMLIAVLRAHDEWGDEDHRVWMMNQDEIDNLNIEGS